MILTFGVFLAPMAGVTDWAFRTVCRTLSPAATVSEMVSSQALIRGNIKCRPLMRPSPPPFGVQLFGSDPEVMAKAAEIVAHDPGVGWIDLNMGCPMPKIVRNGDGCALMRTPELAFRVIEHVVKSVSLPVTVKFRRGWDKGSLNAVEFGVMCQQAGAHALCVHGRTQAQRYGGVSDWDTIGAVKAAVTVPVIANGDVRSLSDAERLLRYTKADAVMVGRSAMGNPWLLRDIYRHLCGLPALPCPTPEERREIIRTQFDLAVQDVGERVARFNLRRHYGKEVFAHGEWKI